MKTASIKAILTKLLEKYDEEPEMPVFFRDRNGVLHAVIGAWQEKNPGDGMKRLVLIEEIG